MGRTHATINLAKPTTPWLWNRRLHLVIVPFQTPKPPTKGTGTMSGCPRSRSRRFRFLKIHFLLHAFLPSSVQISPLSALNTPPKNYPNFSTTHYPVKPENWNWIHPKSLRSQQQVKQINPKNTIKDPPSSTSSNSNYKKQPQQQKCPEKWAGSEPPLCGANSLITTGRGRCASHPRQCTATSEAHSLNVTFWGFVPPWARRRREDEAWGGRETGWEGRGWSERAKKVRLKVREFVVCWRCGCFVVWRNLCLVWKCKCSCSFSSSPASGNGRRKEGPIKTEMLLRCYCFDLLTDSIARSCKQAELVSLGLHCAISVGIRITVVQNCCGLHGLLHVLWATEFTRAHSNYYFSKITAAKFRFGHEVFPSDLQSPRACLPRWPRNLYCAITVGLELAWHKFSVDSIHAGICSHDARYLPIGR